MNRYRIVEGQVLTVDFYIDADSEEKALEIYNGDVTGEITEGKTVLHSSDVELIEKVGQA